MIKYYGLYNDQWYEAESTRPFEPLRADEYMSLRNSQTGVYLRLEKVFAESTHLVGKEYVPLYKWITDSSTVDADTVIVAKLSAIKSENPFVREYIIHITFDPDNGIVKLKPED